MYFADGGDSILSAFSWEPLQAKLQDYQRILCRGKTAYMTVYLASNFIKSANSKRENSKYNAPVVRMRISNHVTTFWRPLFLLGKNKVSFCNSEDFRA
jgi:hypothetical protein